MSKQLTKNFGTKKLTMPSGAHMESMPRRVEVMKATLVDKPFSREGWLFENKWDGQRALAFIDNGRLRLLSRNHNDIKPSYPELHTLPDLVKAKRAILDGEIIILSKTGKADFHLLQSRFGVTNEAKLLALTKAKHAIFAVFDLLYLDGYDLMDVPLLERKKLLKRILPSSKSVIYTTHVLQNGIGFFAKVKKAHGEGMIAKDAQSKYIGRRAKTWLKVKTSMRQEVVIAGYTMPHGAREYFGALELGLYKQGKFISIGQVGTGFRRDTLRDLFNRMQPLKVKTHPFDLEPKSMKETQWIKPKLVCEVQFSEWTRDHKLRHPSFEGLRNDKSPRECTFERSTALSELVTQSKRKVKHAD
jgi:bifunctional non-homologous end joining protein LigD